MVHINKTKIIKRGLNFAGTLGWQFSSIHKSILSASGIYSLVIFCIFVADKVCSQPNCHLAINLIFSLMVCETFSLSLPLAFSLHYVQDRVYFYIFFLDFVLFSFWAFISSFNSGKFFALGTTFRCHKGFSISPSHPFVTVSNFYVIIFLAGIRFLCEVTRSLYIVA